MPFDETLAERVRTALSDLDDVREQKMFGGLSFLLHGNMCCGVLQHELVVRLSPELGEEALAEADTRPMDFTGRPMRGWIMVKAGGIDSDDTLRAWVDRAVSFCSTLPPKG